MVGACLYAAIFSNVAKLIEKLDAAGSRLSASNPNPNPSTVPLTLTLTLTTDPDPS